MSSNFIEGLIAYVSQTQPDYPTLLRAATPEQITHLQDIVGVPLPFEYRQYLERMGEFGMVIAADRPCSISVVIAYYEYVRASGVPLLPECVIIAPGDRLPSVALQKVTGGAERVIAVEDRGPTPRPGEVYAASLPGLLFRQAFHDRHNQLSKSISSAKGRGRVEQKAQADATAQVLGLTKQPFSDAVVSCYEGHDLAVAISYYEGFEVTAIVWAQSEEEAQRVGSAFAGALRLSGLHSFAASGIADGLR